MTELIFALNERVMLAGDAFALANAEMANFVRPAVEALGLRGDGVDSVSISGDEVTITIGGSCRGYSYTDNFVFPLSVFTSGDVGKAAREFLEGEAAKKQELERKAKVAEFERIKKELGYDEQ